MTELPDRLREAGYGPQDEMKDSEPPGDWSARFYDPSTGAVVSTTRKAPTAFRRAVQNRAGAYLDARDGLAPVPAEAHAAGIVTRTALDTVLVILLIAFSIATAGYFVPIWVAMHRKVPSAGSVAVIDILLGWTIIGWIVALAMACRSTDA